MSIRAFTVFAGSLVDTYASYLGVPEASPAHDGVSCRQIPVWLSAEELSEMLTAMAEALEPFLDNDPAPGRTRRLFNAIVMPKPNAEAP